MLKKNRISVKQLASVNLGSCTHFIGDEDLLNSFKEKHDRIVQDIEIAMKNIGFNCNKEKVVGSKLDDGILVSGRIDLYCEKNNDVIIFEMKSSFIGNAKPNDKLQLGIYYVLLSKIGKNVVGAILVYNKDNNELGYESFNVGKYKLSLPKKYFYYIVDLKEAKITAEISNIVRAFKNYSNIDSYIIGKHCDFCKNLNCPFNSKLSA
ncbi:hypothetical protein SJAV_09300 [Sulfurisphaera javensis]|uniref:Uncharacterized protein n=1 Tax=Sulfurisphaera javensis TaxID=2049879 RepID=A0AAT9GQA5_9CREN